MKAPYVVYADFECIVRKIATCEPDNKRSFTVKTEKHEPCGFSYLVVRSDGHQAAKNKYAPYDMRKPKDEIDPWIVNNQETCLFCADPLLVPNFKDSVRVHDHMTGRYRGAAHNECNFKLKLNHKTAPIPVIFHNLKGYDGHLLMQAMTSVQGEIKCIPTNTEKYISFSLGNLRFIDSAKGNACNSEGKHVQRKISR